MLNWTFFFTAQFRVVLVGNDWLKKNECGNFLLGQEKFETDASTSSAKKNTTFSGCVLDRHITMVNTADLFSPDVSDGDLKLRVRECVSLCAPGPHALVLVVNAKEFNAEKRQRMELIVNSFSDQAFQHSIVFIQKHEIKSKKEIKQLIAFCRGRMYQYPYMLSHNRRHDQNSAINAIEDMISQNGFSYVTYGPFKAEECVTDDGSKKRSRQRDENTKAVLLNEKLGESTTVYY